MASSPPTSVVCPLCGSEHERFLPLPANYAASMAAAGCPYRVDQFETLNVDQYTCPSCGASDRDRLMGLYFLRHWVEEGRAGDAHVLELAPSRPLGALLREFAASYRSADLMPGFAMDQVAVTDMGGYADARFDLVFCSHVLEHVVDDGAALRELRRVTRPGGKVVLLVPLPLGLATTDEVAAGEALPGAAERVRRFAQDDHVRMYARDEFIARVGRAGFRLDVLGPQDFPDDSFAGFGLTARSRLYVGTPA